MPPTAPAPNPRALERLFQACQTIHDRTDVELAGELVALAPGLTTCQAIDHLSALRHLSQSAAVLQQQLAPAFVGGGIMLIIRKMRIKGNWLC